jgi:hypothetical protein
MAAQQLQFEFNGGRISVPRGEAPEEKVPVRQVMVASGTAEPAVGVMMEEVVGRKMHAHPGSRRHQDLPFSN